MTTIANLTLFDNEDWVLSVTFTDEVGAAVNLTGAAIVWTTSSGVSGSVADSRITIVDAVNGKAKIFIDKTVHAAVPARLTHEAKVTNAAGEERVFFRGSLDVLKGIAA